MKAYMKHLIFGIMALGISGLIMSCSEEPENIKQEVRLDAATRSVAENLKDFYFDFTRDAVASVDGDEFSETKNVMVSPLSAAQVLGMLMNGFDDEVTSQIIDYIGVDDIWALNDFSHQMLVDLPKVDSKTKFSLNNSIWVGKSLNLKSEYISILSSSYNASIDNIDFTKKENAILRISDKIGCAPADIRNSFMSLDSIYMCAINTLSFQSTWAEEYFKTNKTRKEDFFGENGTTTVNIMHSKGIDADYNFDDEFEICQLKFGNEGYHMYIVLPKKELSLEETAKLLTFERLESLKSEMVPVVLYLSLPRLKLTNCISINQVFNHAGLTVLSEKINFPMLEPSKNGHIILNQNSTLILDEEGVVIKVVTSGVEGAFGLPEIGKPYYMTVDHPFYFFIHEQSTGACLLSGRITDIPN